MATNRTPTVGDNVAAEMKRRRLSQSVLAQHLGLSQAAVSARLRGVTSWRVDELQVVADALGVPISTLLGEVAA